MKNWENLQFYRKYFILRYFIILKRTLILQFISGAPTFCVYMGFHAIVIYQSLKGTSYRPAIFNLFNSKAPHYVQQYLNPIKYFKA